MKQVIKINASSLVLSKCILAWHRTIIQGYKEPVNGDKLVYGVAFHAYINAMFKTGGSIPLAKRDLLAAFRVPKYEQTRNTPHIQNEGHCLVSAYNYWEDYVVKDVTYNVLMIQSYCYYCKDKPDFSECPHCNGTGQKLQPATEVTFEILYYEDDRFQVYLCGTIDKIGQIRNGCYAIGDYKTTSRRDIEDYLKEYEMSAQLRFYLFSLKLMAEKFPDSILGKIGATKVGAFIDGIFLKPNLAENEHRRSEVFQFKDKDINEFRGNLDRAIAKLLLSIVDNSWNIKEGIFNGSCQQKFNKCSYWHVCKAQDDNVEAILLKRDYIQKEYNPLKHNE